MADAERPPLSSVPGLSPSRVHRPARHRTALSLLGSFGVHATVAAIWLGLSSLERPLSLPAHQPDFEIDVVRAEAVEGLAGGPEQIAESAANLIEEIGPDIAAADAPELADAAAVDTADAAAADTTGTAAADLAPEPADVPVAEAPDTELSDDGPPVATDTAAPDLADAVDAAPPTPATVDADLTAGPPPAIAAADPVALAADVSPAADAAPPPDLGADPGAGIAAAAPVAPPVADGPSLATSPGPIDADAAIAGLDVPAPAAGGDLAIPETAAPPGVDLAAAIPPAPDRPGVPDRPVTGGHGRLADATPPLAGTDADPRVAVPVGPVRIDPDTIDAGGMGDGTPPPPVTAAVDGANPPIDTGNRPLVVASLDPTAAADPRPPLAGGADAALDNGGVEVASLADAAAVELDEPLADPSGLRDALGQVLDGIACGAVRARLAPSLDRVEIVGHVANRAARGRLLTELSGLPADLRIDDRGVVTLPSPHCDLVETLIDAGARPMPSDQAVWVGAAAQSQALAVVPGSDVVLDLVTPDTWSHVYVDYFDQEGRVVHLFPTGDGVDAEWSPQRPLRLGDRSQAGAARSVPLIPEGPPGVGLLLTLASTVPLFDPDRPMVERADDYRTRLEIVLRELPFRHPDASTSLAYMVITIGG